MRWRSVKITPGFVCAVGCPAASPKYGVQGERGAVKDKSQTITNRVLRTTTCAAVQGATTRGEHGGDMAFAGGKRGGGLSQRLHAVLLPSSVLHKQKARRCFLRAYLNDAARSQCGYCVTLRRMRLMPGTRKRETASWRMGWNTHNTANGTWVSRFCTTVNDGKYSTAENIHLSSTSCAVLVANQALLMAAWNIRHVPECR